MKNLATTVLSVALAIIAAAPAPAHAAPVNGSIWDSDVAPGHGGVTYTMALRGGEYTEVDITGDGDSDLDLFVYDRFGNLIVSDTGPSDHAHVKLWVNQTGEFRIVIVNLGSNANAYDMWACY